VPVTAESWHYRRAIYYTVMISSFDNFDKKYLELHERKKSPYRQTAKITFSGCNDINF
jgi:hypothetical protein